MMGNEGAHKGCPYQSVAVPVGAPLVGALIATAKTTHQYKDFSLLDYSVIACAIR